MVNILFGYRFENGEATIDSAQSQIIQQIVQNYIDGTSLKTQAEMLTAGKIEFSPGKYIWNKNRVQRLLTNRIYLGDEHHAPILSEETFAEVQQIMQERNTQKNLRRDEIFSSAIVPLICACCGQEAKRNHRPKRKSKTQYICQNPECGKAYSISDEEMWKLVQELMICAEDYETEASGDATMQMELQRLNKEVEWDLQGLDIDGDTLKAKIFECVALQYALLNEIKRESMDFRTETPCSSAYIREIKRRVSAVLIDGNDKIRLRLADGRVIGKDVMENDAS